MLNINFNKSDIASFETGAPLRTAAVIKSSFELRISTIVRPLYFPSTIVSI